MSPSNHKGFPLHMIYGFGSYLYWSCFVGLPKLKQGSCVIHDISKSINIYDIDMGIYQGSILINHMDAAKPLCHLPLGDMIYTKIIVIYIRQCFLINGEVDLHKGFLWHA